MSHSFYYKNPALKKFLTISPKNIFFYFAKWNFLIFSQKKAFLIFQEAETLKSFLYLGNGTFRAQKKKIKKKKKSTPKKFLQEIFPKINFKAPWLKSFLYFLKCNFLIFSYISGNVTFWHQHWKTSYIFSKNLFVFGKRKPLKNSLYFRTQNFLKFLLYFRK